MPAKSFYVGVIGMQLTKTMHFAVAVGATAKSGLTTFGQIMLCFVFIINPRTLILI